ncbi:hypothetical protein EG240_07345 [Paenimyroides tangerinum]|uniref:Uncharacterized protein n=1 Tax=Paenimyroides tangerinum TaxID=2488728 RepID=A0A3P3W997_9FLAO|nr:hypothetical protein [Paenimyroides tangerinum]RRJ91008.1 hypothetical protein EG240_07345 [Paenimyroides tangerinum]
MIELRSNYPKALNDKQICYDMITFLSKQNLNTIEKGYYGAYLVIWANHIWNPMDKLSTFKKGKIELENAIKQDPKNVELRFLRLSIQANVPKILNYDQNIKSDLIIIKEHKDKIQSNQLLKMVNELIINAENSN